MTARLWDRLLCAFFPRRCRYCGALIVPERAVCEACETALPRIAPPACPDCGHAKDDCVCKHKKQKFDAVCAPFYYTDAIRRAVHRLKFEGRTYLAESYGADIANAVRLHFAGRSFDAVAFVPFTKRQRRKRAYNPGKLLAEATAKALDVPCLPLLEKLYETETQHRLPASERTGNVFGVYEVAPDADVKNKRILLVDDIKTTGATLSECAKVLKLAGASSVHAAVFAIARRRKPGAQTPEKTQPGA